MVFQSTTTSAPMRVQTKSPSSTSIKSQLKSMLIHKHRQTNQFNSFIYLFLLDLQHPPLCRQVHFGTPSALICWSSNPKKAHWMRNFPPSMSWAWASSAASVVEVIVLAAEFQKPTRKTHGWDREWTEEMRHTHTTICVGTRKTALILTTGFTLMPRLTCRTPSLSWNVIKILKQQEQALRYFNFSWNIFIKNSLI